MTSKMTSKFNPDSPAFVPSFNFNLPFKIVGKKPSKKTSKKPLKYRSKNGELWAPAKGWLISYRCAACREIMTRKEASKCPQRINACDHITCAKCIVRSYLVDLNPLCPVKDCGKCVNPKQKEPVLPLEVLTTSMAIVTPPASVTEEITGCGFCDKKSGCGCNEEIDLTPQKSHYCGDPECEWDCGELWCGCIDVCRGRCGFNSDIFSRW